MIKKFLKIPYIPYFLLYKIILFNNKKKKKLLIHGLDHLQLFH